MVKYKLTGEDWRRMEGRLLTAPQSVCAQAELRWCPEDTGHPWAQQKPRHANVHLVTQQTCFIYTHTQVYIHIKIHIYEQGK